MAAESSIPRNSILWVLVALTLALPPFSLGLAHGQASSTAKMRDLRNYRGKDLFNYNSVVGTFRKEDTAGVRRFLNSLRVSYKTHDLHRDWEIFSLVLPLMIKERKLDVSNTDRLCILPGWDKYGRLNGFQLQTVAMALAQCRFIYHVYLYYEPVVAGLHLPVEVSVYIPNRRVFFSHPNDPSPHEAENGVRRIISAFFEKYGNPDLHIAAKSSNLYEFQIELTGLRSAVLTDEKYIENVNGVLAISPSFAENGINLDWELSGEYAPMPYGIKPKPEKYKDFEPKYRTELQRLADHFGEYIRQTYNGSISEAQ